MYLIRRGDYNVWASLLCPSHACKSKSTLQLAQEQRQLHYWLLSGGMFSKWLCRACCKIWGIQSLGKTEGKGTKNKSKTTFLSVFLQCKDAIKLERGMEYKSLSNVQRKTIKVKLSYLIAFECPLWLDLKVSEITCTLKIAPVPKINIQLE